MNCPKLVIYRSSSDATPASELCTLVDAYLFILSSEVSKKATKPAPEPSGRDGTTVQGDSANVSSVHH